MNFKNFRLNIIFRVLLIVLAVFLFYYSFSTNYFFTPIIVGVIIIFLVISLIRHIDKTNRELAGFLESIRFSEFTRTFNLNSMGASFSELSNAFNEVIKDFQRVREEKEEHFYYLQTILQNIDICVIAYRTDGSIELINKAAKKLFQVTGLRNIHGLNSFSPELVKLLLNIQPGKNELIKVQDDDDFLQLAINSSTFKIKDKIVTLVAIKDIQNVLEEQETEAWQKLIRVLTHEIMNSIAPISSIATTLTTVAKNLPVDENKNHLIDSESLDEINQALHTINKRSDGLLHFVDTYRNLTKIPQPNFVICKVKSILDNIYNLMSGDLKSRNVELFVKTEPDNISFTADEQLIEQVLINLTKNAFQAMQSQDKGEIHLYSFFNKRGRVTIQVTDNGPGILPDVLEKIFIPFFTTKPNGSGIGLALSRQIIKLHNGSLTAKSTPEEGTVFTLTF